MKTKFTLLAVFIAAFFSGFAQQIPNGSFENFDNSYTPTGWVGVEDLLSAAGFPITSSIFTFKDNTAFTVGANSLKLVTDTIAGFPQAGTQSGVASLGTGSLDLSNGAVTFTGVPFAYRPDSIVFDFQYSSPTADTAAFFLGLTYQTTAILGAQGQAGIGFALTAEANWTHVAIPLAQFYLSNQTPDSITLQFLSSNSNNPVIGSTLHIDGLRFGYVNTPITATITAAGPTTYCTGDSVTLTANIGTGYTYQWNLGGTAITGATAATYNAKGSGSYTVTLDSASSTATSNAIVVTDTACGINVGINTIAATHLSVYPNPATSLLNINADVNMAGFTLQMYDIVGRLVVSQILEGSSNAINVAKLANGTYIYRITDKDSNLVSQSKFNVIK